MKILLLIIYYPPVLNSAARLFSELAEGLAGRGHQVTVLTTYPERYLANEGTQKLPKREKSNVQVYRLKNLRLPKQVPLLRGLEDILYGVQYYLKEWGLGQHDVVIAYSPPLPFGATAVLLARRWKARAVVNVQDLYPRSAVDLGLLENRALIWLGEWLERWVYHHAHGITVHSEGNRDHVVAHGGSAEKTWVVPNWIDLAKYLPGPRENGFRRKHAPCARFVVSYAGVMGFAQGVGDILKAAAIVAKETTDVVFLLAGDGVRLPKLKAMATDLALKNVLFLPHLPEDEYIALLQASDVCLVTLHEGLKTPVVPGKLPCIMGVSRPAICSTPPQSDARLIVEEARCGLWVPAASPKALAEAVLTLNGDHALADEMGDNGRRYAEQHFDREKCISRYEEIIAKVL